MTSPDPPLPPSSPGASGASPTSPPASAAPVAPAAPPASAAGAATPDEGPAPEPVPFPEALLHPAIEAAASLWEPLAARAWAETARRGRGLLAMRWEELEATAAAARSHRGEPAEPGESGAPGEPGESGDPANPASPAAARPTRSPEPPATWIPLSIVSRGDDFRGLLKTYDPRRQVMLLVAHADGGEAVFGLECDGDRRPAPDVCHARRMEHAEAGAAPDASAASPASPASPGDPPATASAPDA